MRAQPTGRRSVPLGALFIVLAFACVAIMSALGKALHAMPTAMSVFFQSAISWLLLLPWAFRDKTPSPRTSHVGLHLFRAITGLLSQALMFIAVKRMALASAALLANAAPLFIPLVALVWLKHGISGVSACGLLLGFAGVMLILHPSAALFEHPAALFAVAAALASALALVAVNQLSKSEPGWRILFYYFLFSTLAAAPFAIGSWRMPQVMEWLFLFGVGVLMALSQLLIVLAYRHASAVQIAPYNYSVVVFSGLIGWLAFGDEPDLFAIFGAVLVAAGGVVSTVLGGSRPAAHHGWVGHGMSFWRNAERP